MAVQERQITFIYFAAFPAIGIPAVLRKSARYRIGDSVMVRQIKEQPIEARTIQLLPCIEKSYPVNEELALYLKEYLGKLWSLISHAASFAKSELNVFLCSGFEVCLCRTGN